MRALLDVNVLIALLDQDHVHHKAARAWWDQQKSNGWASCPLTENGVVRILSSTSYKGGPFSAFDVVAGLKEFIRKTDHAFWTDTLSILDDRTFDAAKLTSSKLTDSYLLALAHTNNGSFATLDLTAATDTVRGISPASLVRIV